MVAQRTHHHAKNSAYYLSNITLETALHTVDGVLYASITYFMLHYRAFSNPANRACLFSPFPFAMCGGLLGGTLNTIARGLTSTTPKPPTPPKLETTTATAHFLIYTGVIIIQSIMGSMLVQASALLTPNQDMAFALAGGTFVCCWVG